MVAVAKPIETRVWRAWFNIENGLIARYFLADGKQDAVKKAKSLAASVRGKLAFEPADFCTPDLATVSDLGILDFLSTDDFHCLLIDPLKQLNQQMTDLKYSCQSLAIFKRRESFLQSIREQRGRYGTN